MRTRRTGAVLGGLLALALAWALAPVSAPLYDGVGFPDEPYRYVVPPASAKATKPPGTARATVPMAGGRSTQAVYEQSDESGPQVSVYIPTGGLRGPASATSAEVLAAPLAPDPSTTLMTTDGNVYRVQVAGSDGFSYAGGGGVGTIVLRQTSPGESPPTVVYRSGPGKDWRTLPTQKAGNDIYRASLAGLGDYALAYVAAGGLQPSGGSRVPVQAIVLGVVVLLLAGALLAIRLSRRRSA